MNKQIILRLHPQSNFFSDLKKKFTEKEVFGMGHAISPTVDNIISGIIKTLKNEANRQGQTTSENIKLKFKSEEYIAPNFYEEMQENIDIALNRRVHSTTLERFADFAIEFMNEVADRQAEDEKIKIPAFIDTDKELQAIIDYVTQNWDGFDTVDAKEFFSKVWQLSLEKTKNRFNEYAFTDLVEKWNSEREDYSKWQEAGAKFKEKDLRTILIDDEIKQIPMKILMSTMQLHRYLRNNWDYEQNVNRIIAEIKEVFPDAKKLKPKGWSELAKNYSEYDGMEEFDDQKAKEEFKGTQFELASSYSFEIRIALPHVMYDDKEQGRKPLEVLVGAVLGHACCVSENNNATKMLKELVELKNEYSQPQYYKEAVTEFNPEFKEPLNQAMFAFFYENKLDDQAMDQKLKKVLGIKEENNKKPKF